MDFVWPKIIPSYSDSGNRITIQVLGHDHHLGFLPRSSSLVQRQSLSTEPKADDRLIHNKSVIKSPLLVTNSSEDLSHARSRV